MLFIFSLELSPYQIRSADNENTSTSIPSKVSLE